MLKELFKFHSKEEDFRVKCLILILLGIALIINPANAYETDWSYSVTTASGSQTSHGNHFHAHIGNVTDDYWYEYQWIMDNQCSLRFYDNPNLGPIPIEVKRTSDNLTVITGMLTSTHTGSLDCSAVAHWQIDIDFEGQMINQSITDGTDVTVYGAFGTTYTTYYGSGSGTPVFPPPFAISQAQGYSSTTQATMVTKNVGPGPEAPVITDFTNDMSCYYPGQAIAFESDVSGELEDQLTWTWTWEIYDGDTKISEDTDPVEAIMTAPGVGVYDVQLTVTNDGGTDFLQKLDMINVTLGGNCTGINNWTPFPGVTTPVPTAAVFPTMTVPPAPFINQTGISHMINESMWGNYSLAYRLYIDAVGDSVNQTVVGTVVVVTSPFAFITNGIAVVINLFSESMAGLMSYTTIPLSITARLINVMPWEIQSLITAGLAIDAIFLMFYGKG